MRSRTVAEENNGSLVNPPVLFDWSGWVGCLRATPVQPRLASWSALLRSCWRCWWSRRCGSTIQRFTTCCTGAWAEADAGQMMDALQKANIPVKIDPRSGALMVPADQVCFRARLKLATQGLLRSTVNGLESRLQNSFGLSQFMETARYQH
ncbi:MAG: hypothetical protein IPL99_22315, partial [Candidatus Competibacteraceae bacterium]|nr:hypothetical protein [Candidatus Competibacteraceae bacterium]